LSLLALITVALALAAHYYYKGFYRASPTSIHSINKINSNEALRINNKASHIKSFALKSGFNTKIIFLVDMSLPSGQNRFFVYDLQSDSIIRSSLVAHGSANTRFSFTPKFSNQKESGCTALGKYRIGKNYKGRFGVAYKLYGLDSTNSNAFSRNIVLHSYSCVPDQETYPYPICNSLGCPMVSPLFLKSLQVIIDKSKEPVLLWIFN